MSKSRVKFTLNERRKRCEYLYKRMNAEQNPEQAEAFAERLKFHWLKLLEQLHGNLRSPH